MTPASEQRLIVIERDFGRCFARDTIEGHTACYDRYGAGATPSTMDACHLYPKSWLRNRIASLRRRGGDHPLLSRPEDEILYDPRNAKTMCPLAHHRFDNLGGKHRCAVDQLPDHFLEFLEEYKVKHWLYEYYENKPVERIDATGTALPW